MLTMPTVLTVLAMYTVFTVFTIVYSVNNRVPCEWRHNRYIVSASVGTSGCVGVGSRAQPIQLCRLCWVDCGHKTHKKNVRFTVMMVSPRRVATENFFGIFPVLFRRIDLTELSARLACAGDALARGCAWQANHWKNSYNAHDYHDFWELLIFTCQERLM